MFLKKMSSYTTYADYDKEHNLIEDTIRNIPPERMVAYSSGMGYDAVDISQEKNKMPVRQEPPLPSDKDAGSGYGYTKPIQLSKAPDGEYRLQNNI